MRKTGAKLGTQAELIGKVAHETDSKKVLTHMFPFTYLAYPTMASLYETVPAHYLCS
jgi:hypothetical protein